MTRRSRRRPGFTSAGRESAAHLASLALATPASIEAQQARVRALNAACEAYGLPFEMAGVIYDTVGPEKFDAACRAEMEG